MELFGSLHRPLRAIEIAKALGTHSSTTNQLLKTMVDSAHLIFDARAKTYLPSPRLSAFGAWLCATYGSETPLRAILDEVHERTGMVVTASTANGLFLQVIDLAGEINHGGERGLRVSIFGSAIGSAYLAMMDDDEVARLAERARIPQTQLLDILQSAARIRHEGYAAGPATGDAFWSVAVPLPLEAMGTPAVLGLAGSPSEVQSRVGDLAALMREAIARQLPPSA